MIFLPAPQKMVLQSGSFAINLQTKIVLSGETGALAQAGARQLRAELHQFAGIQVDILRGQAREGDILLTLQPGLPSQGYRLELSPVKAVLSGGDEVGLLHGVQTLRQLIRQSSCELPALTIEDAPVYPCRGFYHDVSRGRMPTLETFKRLADEACFYKLNQLQLYVEHTYLFRDLSEMWINGAPLCAEEIMELDAYCAGIGVELVPSLSCFGHLFELLRTKTYHRLCELPEAETMPSTMINRMHHHTLNISDPRAFTLVKSMIEEFMPLFRSRYFNICADETFDLGKGRGKEQMEKVGERDYYMGFVRQLCECVASHGRTPMFWGDIVLRFADALKELPEGTICLNWGYSPKETGDATRTLAQSGAVQYVCPGCSGWNEWMYRLRDSYDNISRMASYGRANGAVGLLNTDWGDYGHINDPLFSLPGLIYGAVFSWGEAEPSFDELNDAISRLAYLDNSGSVVGLLAQMQEEVVYSWRDVVQHMEWTLGTFEKDPVSFNEATASMSEVKNAELNATLTKLRAASSCMDTSRRAMLDAWSIVGEGIRLWNLVGSALAQGRKEPTLASALENWYHLYARLWRSSCHESELWRIRRVVCWYADELREA